MATRPPGHTAQLSTGPGAAAGGASSGAGPAPSMSCFSWAESAAKRAPSERREIPGDTAGILHYHAISCGSWPPADTTCTSVCFISKSILAFAARMQQMHRNYRRASQVSISESQQPVSRVSGRNRTCQSW